MSAKHTPKPWKSSGQRQKTIGISVYRDDGPGENWARICRNVRSLEDAALIAAAPQLLEVCKLIERLELESANCEECGDFGVAELCEIHFPLADTARLKRRALIREIEEEG